MTALEVSGLTVRFGGHLAVGDVSLQVDAGRISGLIGPNGAGKTTTFNAICGVITPTAGRVLLGGRGHLQAQHPSSAPGRASVARSSGSRCSPR